MDDSIRRQAVIDAIDAIAAEVEDGDGFQHDKWREYFSNLPSAQKRGEWVEREVKPVRKTGIYEVQSAKCSVCGRYHTKPYLYFFDADNYCPNCGARMVEEHG